MILSKFYLPAPNEDGVFLENLTSSDFVEWSSVYEFELFKDNPDKAYFCIAENPNALSRALGNFEKFISPVCESENFPSSDTEKILTKEKGIAKLLPSGNWKAEQKAKITCLNKNAVQQREEIGVLKLKQDSVKFCTDCGKEISSDAMFCSKCGKATIENIQKKYPKKVIKDKKPDLNLVDTTEQDAEKDVHSLFGYFVKCLKNYAVFSGRARRREFWGFYLFDTIFYVIVLVIFGLESTMDYIYCFATFLPSLAVVCRRMHDVGKSGWNWLWCITIIGILYVLFLLVSDSDAGSNEYGENPKNAA